MKKIKDCYKTLENEDFVNKKGDFLIFKKDIGDKICLQIKQYDVRKPHHYPSGIVIYLKSEYIKQCSHLGFSDFCYRRVK